MTGPAADSEHAFPVRPLEAEARRTGTLDGGDAVRRFIHASDDVDLDYLHWSDRHAEPWAVLLAWLSARVPSGSPRPTGGGP